MDSKLVITVLISIVATVSGVSGWFIKSYLEESRKTREKLWQERRSIYMKFIEPMIHLFHGIGIDDKAEQDKALKMIATYEYRETAFEIVLISSDEVVNAYNKFMEKIYESGPSDNSENESSDSSAGLVLMELWSKILLAIREDIVSKTDIGKWDMIRWMITDIHNYLDDNDELIEKVD